jgi:glycosyltransferase EpsD
MTNKILFCATVDYHFQAFHLPYMKWFKDQGWEVHVAAGGNMDLPFVNQKYNIPIERSPFHFKNIIAYKKLKEIIDQNQYKLVHCHTPMGGALARLASRRARKKGTKVIYTAHGFHFCKGAPLFNWLMYYPIEKMMARYTDCLITINNEDFNLAKRKLTSAKRIEHVHGVGVDIERFKPVTEKEKCSLKITGGYAPSDFLLFYAAEFNKNKNQQMLIHALALIKEEVLQAKLLMAGDGPLQNDCQELAKKLGIEKMVEFLGYRKDIDKLLPMCDVAVASSIREGLPVNIMEAMSCGLPVIAVDNRGHRELVKDEENGFVVHPNDIRAFGKRIVELYQSKDARRRMEVESVNKMGSYSLSKVASELSHLYLSYMVEERDEAKNKYSSTYL